MPLLLPTNTWPCEFLRLPLSVPELRHHEAGCLSKGAWLWHQPNRMDAARSPAMLTFNLFVAETWESDGGNPKGWAEKAKLTEMPLSGSDIRANAVTIQLLPSFLLALGKVP